jgi:hypothetical protein
VAIDSRVREIVNEAAEFATQDPEPDTSELYTDILLQAPEGPVRLAATQALAGIVGHEHVVRPYRGFRSPTGILISMPETLLLPPGASQSNAD